MTGLGSDHTHRDLVIAILLSAGLPAFIWYYGDIETALQVAAFPLALALAWRWPLGIALAFVSLSCFRLHDAFPALQPLRLPTMFGGLLIITAGLHVVAKNVTVFFRRELMLAIVFTVHVLVGMLFAVDRQVAYDAWSGSFIKVVLVALLIAWISKWPRDARPLSNVITLSGVVISLVALYNWFNGLNLVEGTRVAIGGPASLIGDPNDLTFVLLFAVAFTLSMCLAEENGNGARVLFGSALFVILWAIIATKSRGGLIGVVAVFAVYFTNRYKLNMKYLLMLGLLAGALVVLSGVMGREYSSETSSAVDDSSNVRLAAWSAAFRMALTRPIFGVGFENFIEMYWAYTNLWTGKNKAVHSIWFGVMAESGFVGFAIYMSMIWCTLRSGFSMLRKVNTQAADPRLRTLGLALVAGLLGTLAAGTFLTQAYSWPVFTQIALIAALAHHVEGLQPAPLATATASRQTGTPQMTAPGPVVSR